MIGNDEAAQAVLYDAALAARDAFDARLYAAVRMLRSTGQRVGPSTGYLSDAAAGNEGPGRGRVPMLAGLASAATRSGGPGS